MEGCWPVLITVFGQNMYGLALHLLEEVLGIDIPSEAPGFPVIQCGELPASNEFCTR